MHYFPQVEVITPDYRYWNPLSKEPCATYVWDQGKWWCGLPDEGTQTLLDLGDLLQGKRTLSANVKLFGATIGKHAPTEPGKGHSWRGAV